jgi:hypothetical protein
MLVCTVAMQVALGLQQFTITTVLKPEGQTYHKTIKNSKFAAIDTGCGVKNQHSQAEMRAVPIYHLSQSGIRIIKVLKLELHCLVREGQ